MISATRADNTCSERGEWNKPFWGKVLGRVMKKPSNNKDALLLLAGYCLAGMVLTTAASWLQNQLFGGGGIPTPAFFLLPATLGGIVGGAMGRMKWQREHAQMAANHDPLTGLPNRGAFERAVEREILRAERFSTPLGLVMFDVDKFKGINDTHGHVAGDRVLKAIANAVSGVTRRTDMFARWAGDEFVLLAPGTDTSGCRTLAEKVRKAVAYLTFEGDLHVTISVGVAAHTYADDPVRLLNRADEALYHAKRAGRNCTATTRCLRSTGTWTSIP
jgi:diguanylate cyclase (GGDEF)-like protein